MSELTTEAGIIAETAPPAPRSGAAAHAGITFAGLMLANVFGYVFYSLVSRALGVEAYGTFSSLFAIVLILSSPALIAQMVVAKLTSDLAGDADRVAGLVRIVDRLALIIALAVGAALAASAVPLAHFLHLTDPVLIVLAGLSVVGAIALPFLRGLLQGISAFTAFSISVVAEALGRAVFAPALGIVAGLRGAIGGVAVGYVAALVYTFAAGAPHRRGTAIPLSLRALARSSAPIALAVFCVNVLTFYDLVLAKRYLDPHTVGLYGAAALASRALYAVVAFVPIVLLPQAAGRAARGERTRGLFVQSLGVAAVICGGGIAFFALFPHFVVVTIAGRPFADAAAFLLPYVLAISALALTNVVSTYNIARGRTGFVAALALVALGEIVAVVMRHRSAADLLQTIVIGHTCALAAAATSLGGSSRGPAGTGPRRLP